MGIKKSTPKKIRDLDVSMFLFSVNWLLYLALKWFINIFSAVESLIDYGGIWGQTYKASHQIENIEMKTSGNF